MTVDQYRRNAAECLAILAFVMDPRLRLALLAMAASWTHLAEHAEKNSRPDLACETLPEKTAPVD
jgi:hypothetical protein